MYADTSLCRSTCWARRVAVVVVAALLFSLLAATVIAAPLDRPTAYYIHTVRPGETLASIAARYGISVQELRESNNLFNRAELVSCGPNADSTRVEGTVRLNGQPANGHRVVFSWQPDGEVVGRVTSGEESLPGHYTHILQASGPREGNWWFWIEDTGENRISEMAFVRTDLLPHTGNCQRAVIDFDIHDASLIYVGRTLHIPAGGDTTVLIGGESLASIAAKYGISVQQLRVANNLFNTGELVSCAPNADSTQAEGTVRLNGQPVNGYRVVFSWQPDGAVVGRTTSGGRHPGHYSHIIRGAGPREGNWWFWIENSAGNRITEMAFVHTDSHPHTGMCQRAVIDFDIKDANLIYIGRRLHIPVGGDSTGPQPEPPPTTIVWTGAYYNSRELSSSPVLTRQDAAIDFDWLTGSPDARVHSDNFSVVWTTSSHFQAGTYRFSTRSDDGVRVYVDDVLLFADWNIHPATEMFGDIDLSGGVHAIRVEYFEAEGLASVSVWWEKRQ